MINTPKINEPLPGGAGETTFTRQLRTWGKKVVRALIRQNVHGDGRKISVSKMAEGGVSVHYIEDPPREIGFYAYWKSGAALGRDVSTLIVRAGRIYTALGTLTITEKSITPPAAGTGDNYYWVQVDYDFSASTQTATWKTGTTLPAYLVDTDTDGTYDRVNLPIVMLEEKSNGIWRINQRQYGDAALRLYQEIDNYTPWVRDVPFLAYWEGLGEYGTASETMWIKNGHVYTPVGTAGVTAGFYTPGSGNKYYWAQVDYSFSGTPSVSASMQQGSSFPVFAVDTNADGNYDRINLPVCYVTDEGPNGYKIHQRILGDAVIPIVGQTMYPAVCLDTDYSTATGIFRKQTGYMRFIGGNMVSLDGGSWSTVFTAEDCVTTTTTTT